MKEMKTKNKNPKIKKIKLNKTAKIILICVLVAIVIAALAVGIRLGTATKTSDLTFYTVRKETYENVIEISGNISAAEEQTLQAAGDGTVQKVYVKEGDFVKKGQILIELDAVEQRYALAKHEYEMEQTKVNGSRRDYELMETQKQVLEQKIQDRMVIAYFDGIIVELDVSEGDVVEAKDEVGTIINRDYMSAEVEIVENDVYKLKIGQKVNFTFPAYSNLEVTGYVESFPAVGRITSRGATVVDATVRIDNPPDEILPNYSFTGKIEITEPQELLVVERSAIGYKGGKAFAEKVLDNNEVERVDVKVVPYDDTYVKVLEGLEENDVLRNQGTGLKSGKNRMKGKDGPGGPGGGPGGGGPGGGMPPA
ncbi:MAG: efflux RND transporter periplasmic adaptor subunit [Treponemataceae bacterium]|nr:efflux RND transporter periplasmic adaptor subunit [Treponemataceae bacterium]